MNAGKKGMISTDLRKSTIRQKAADKLQRRTSQHWQKGVESDRVDLDANLDQENSTWRINLLLFL